MKITELIQACHLVATRDLAKLYGVKTKRINESVKNNPEKFPERFSWKLNDYESKKVLFEIFDQKNIELIGGKYKNPRVFTEQGIAMLATILKSKTAIQVSIRIMDTFVTMRKFINENKDIFKRLTTIKYKQFEHDNNFDKVFNALEPKKKKM